MSNQKPKRKAVDVDADTPLVLEGALTRRRRGSVFPEAKALLEAELGRGLVHSVELADGVLTATVVNWKREPVTKTVNAAQQLQWSNDFRREHVLAYAQALKDEFRAFVTEQEALVVRMLSRKAELEALFPEYGVGFVPDGMMKVLLPSHNSRHRVVQEVDTRASAIEPAGRGEVDSSLADDHPELVAFAESDQVEMVIQDESMGKYSFDLTCLQGEPVRGKKFHWRVTKRAPLEAVAIGISGRRFTADLKEIFDGEPYTVRDRALSDAAAQPEPQSHDAHVWRHHTLDQGVYSLRWPVRLNDELVDLAKTVVESDEPVAMPAALLHYLSRRQALLDLLRRLGCAPHRIPFAVGRRKYLLTDVQAFLRADGAAASRALSQRLVGDVQGAIAAGDIFFALPPELIFQIAGFLDEQSRKPACIASRLFGVAASAREILNRDPSWDWW